MDWGAKASWIALIVAIISPAITTYLNNRFQLKAKSIDNFSKILPTPNIFIVGFA